MPKRTLPRIEAVSADGRLSLRVRWRTGESSRVDVSGPVRALRAFAPLREDAALFRKVRVGEHGTDVVWNDDLDMSAEMLWRLAQEQSGTTMSAEAFRRWRERRTYSLDGAAKALGLSRRMVAYYDGGEKPIPRTVALATRALDMMEPT